MSQTKAQLLDGKSATIQFTGGSASAPSVSFTGDTNTGIYSPGADQVAISTGGSGRLFVDASGNVGVGNNAPLSAAGYTSLRLNGSTGGLIELTSAATRVLQIQSLGAAGGAQITTIDNGSSPPLIFGTNSAERLRITSAGLVGVGTSTPATALDVNGTITARGSLIFKDANNSNTYGLRALSGIIVADTGTNYPTGWNFQYGNTASSALYIDSSGRVGVGTTSPATLLHASGTGSQEIRLTANTSGDLRLGLDASGAFYNWIELERSSGALRFATANTERLRIDSSGRVGIGTSSPGTATHIRGTNTTTNFTVSNISGLLTLQDTSTAAGAGARIAFGCAYSGTNSTGQAIIGASKEPGEGTGSEQSRSSLVFHTSNFASGVRETMRLDPDGRLGVGTTSPTDVLHAYRSTAADVYFRSENSLTNSAIGTAASGATFVYNAGAYPITFSTSATERLRIDSSGRVGIGTSSPAYPLDLGTSNDGRARQWFATTSFIGDQGDGTGFQVRALGAGTSGIKFANYANNVEYGRFDSSGRLGIGTSNVLGILHAKATTNGNFHIRTLPDVGGSGEGFAIDSLNDAQNSVRPIGFRATTYSFFGSGTTYATLNSTGLGIGTTPDSRLHVSDGSGNALRIGYNPGSNNFNIHDAAQHLFRNNGGASEYGRFDSSGRLLVGTSTSIGLFGQSEKNLQLSSGSGATDAGVTIRSFGNNANAGGIDLIKSRGTGATNTIVQSGDNLGNIYFSGGDGTNFRRAADIQAFVEGTPATGSVAGRLVFSTTADGSNSPTERMRITNDGRIQAGTTGTLNNEQVRIFAASGRQALTTQLTTDGNSHFQGFSSGGTAVVIILGNGNIQNTNNSYGAISDLKLKENIVDANSQWSDIKALQVRNYNFKEGQTHTQIGLIAQEVELVSPGLVYESPDRNADGNNLGTVTKSVNYSVLYMKAVKALQEAMERIEQLEAEMVTVKAQLS